MVRRRAARYAVSSAGGSRLALGLLTLALMSGGLLPAQEADADAPAQGSPAQDAAATEGLPAADIESRRQALESWAFEPVAIEGISYRLLLDRHDSSFVLWTRRANVPFYSSWSRRGFASVRLRDGRVLPVDRVESLDAGTRRVRFRAASSAGELPPVWLELEDLRSPTALAIRFEVPPESRDRVAAVRLLDDALWTTDADDGGMALPRGTGAWLEPDTRDFDELRLRGFPLEPRDLDGIRDDGRDATPRCSLPVLGVYRLETPVILWWDDPEVEVRAHRREVLDDRFPGRAGLFLDVELAEVAGEVRILCLSELEVGAFEIARAYRTVLDNESELPTLRFKTGSDMRHRALIDAAVVRARVTSTRPAPFVGAEARHTFADLRSIVRHWREKLEIPAGLLLVEDWIDERATSQEDPWRAAEEAGGTEELRALTHELDESGWLVGLTIDRDQLTRPSLPGETLASAWRRAVAAAREESGLAALHDLYEPDLVLVRESAAARDHERVDWDALRDAQHALGKAAVETFGLYGASPTGLFPAAHAAVLIGGIDDKLRRPTQRAVFSLVPACLGHTARLLPSGEGLGPGDGPAFLAGLLYGEVPTYALPPGPDQEADEEPAAADSDAVFARPDGWTAARGLGPRDTFIKRTWEASAYLARERARSRLTGVRALTADGRVQESWFGPDLRVLVNFGPEDWEDPESGMLLPPLGFFVKHPFFHAFHARRAFGAEFEEPAFFTIRSLEGKMILRAESVRLWRGFGPRRLRIGGKEFDVDDELITRIW